MSSSQRLSVSSIKKSSSSGPAKTLAAPKAAPAAKRWHHSLAVAFVLIGLTGLVVALYKTQVPSRDHQPAVVTLADDVDEAVSQGGRPVRSVVRNPPPTSKEGEEEEPRRVGVQHPRVEATRGFDLDTTAPSNEDDLPDNSTGSMDAPQAIAEIEVRRRSPAKKKSTNATSDRCASPARFTVCSKHNREEFFFDAEKNECRSKSLELPPPCLSGQNRFKNFRECRLACLDQTAEDRCRAEPLFQRCTPEDIARQWWYLKDGACRVWKFPNSNCVSPRLALFESQEACYSLCVAGHPTARHPACSETPVEHACTAIHLVYPVQARPLKDRLTCVQPDSSEPKCLTGRNQFHTEESCREACLQT